MKLNIGSGEKKQSGYINLDIIPYANIDVVANLDKKLPFKNNQFSEVNAFHVLEHVKDLVFTLTELHRVCKPGAIIKMKSPYYKSKGAFKDPTHKQFFTDETFDYFDPEIIRQSDLPNYQFNAKFKVKTRAYIWASDWIGILPFKHFLKNYFWNIARTIYFELKVIK
jgi:predicted SAM-dependent methyltransferase